MLMALWCKTLYIVSSTILLCCIAYWASQLAMRQWSRSVLSTGLWTRSIMNYCIILNSDLWSWTLRLGHGTIACTCSGLSDAMERGIPALLVSDGVRNSLVYPVPSPRKVMSDLVRNDSIYPVKGWLQAVEWTFCKICWARSFNNPITSWPSLWTGDVGQVGDEGTVVSHQPCVPWQIRRRLYVIVCAYHMKPIQCNTS